MAKDDIRRKILFNFNPLIKNIFVESVVDGVSLTTIASRDNIVCEGDILAHVIEPNDPRYKQLSNPRIEEMVTDFRNATAVNAIYDENKKQFISKIYGFVKIVDGKCIDVFPVVEVSPDAMSAYVYIYPNPDKKFPTIKEIQQIISAEGIMFPRSAGEIQADLEAIKDGTQKTGTKLLIAEGTEPADGHIEYVELRKNIEKTVGTIQEDGKIDYKEKDVFVYVKKDELICERIPEVQPVEGVDVYGNNIKAVMLGETKFRIGTNLKSHQYNENLFVASVDGVLNLTNDVINVEDRLIVPSDVNLETGNIHFDGNVEINGNVLQGFTVNVTGDLYVKGNIEDATVNAGGDIVVKNGIIGRERCNVSAGQDLTANFVQNSEIKVGRNLIIMESVVGSKVYAKEKVTISGHVHGGEVMARYFIEVGIAGSVSETKTILSVGKDPEIEEQLDAVEEEIKKLQTKYKDHIQEVTMYFGEDALINAKNIFPKLTSQRKEKFKELLTSIRNRTQELNELKSRREELKSKLQFDRPPEVKINEAAYPNVTIRIKSMIKPLKSKTLHTIFKEDPARKEIVFD